MLPNSNKYTRINETVDAIQLTKDNVEEVYEKFDECSRATDYKTYISVYSFNNDINLYVTLTDWIVTDVMKNLHVYTDAEFKQLYRNNCALTIAEKIEYKAIEILRPGGSIHRYVNVSDLQKVGGWLKFYSTRMGVIAKYHVDGQIVGYEKGCDIDETINM